MSIAARLIIILGICLYSPVRVYSCAIPVFRYALEYWEADDYYLEIFFKKTLNTEEQELVNMLRGAQKSQTGTNLEIKLINIEESSPNASLSNINYPLSAAFPWMVLRYPRITGISDVLWSGPLNRSNIAQIVNSPARERIVRMLITETTAVWVLAECGDKKKDQAAYDLLTKELKRLEQTLKLPDPELWWDRSKGIPPEKVPPVKFEIIRVSRNDPDEEQLINMLIHSEHDLGEFADEPIVFPVFGRGIALYAIVGKGINEWNIREAAEFITGPCSCQAKILNPGTDLLMSVAWDKVIDNITDINIANPLRGIGDFSNREEEAKRLLEEATRKHIAKVSNKDIPMEKTGTSAPQYPPEKSGIDIIPENEKSSIHAGSEKKELTIKGENNNKSAFFDNDEGIPRKKVLPENTEKQKLLKTLALYLAGLAVIVLIIGVIIYNKSFR